MSDFQFLYPYWLLALLPIALIMAWEAYKPKQESLIAPHLARALGVERIDRSPQTLLFIGLALAIIVFALAGPSVEKQTKPTFANTTARVLIMDMSRSMYATDNKPNRLTQARYKAQDILSHWKDGYTGLVSYAADAYTVAPLTTDTATIENLLPNLSPNIMPYPGANAAKGIKQAIKLMKDSQESSGSFVLITDDIDNQEKNDIQSLLQGSKWNLVILGIGSENGAPIPTTDGPLLKTQNGTTVIAKSNFKNMSELANAVNGTFVAITVNNQDVQTVIKETKSSLISAGEKNRQSINDRTNDGYWLLPLLLIFALSLFRKGLIFCFIVVALLNTPLQKTYASPWLNNDQTAKQEFDHKQYEKAAKQFKNPEWIGASYYRAGKYKQAIENLSSIKHPSSETEYNLANALAKDGQLTQAIKHYQNVLAKDPNNADAKHNLSIVKKALKQQHSKKNPQQNHTNNKKDKKTNNQHSQSSSKKNSQHNSNKHSNKHSNKQKQSHSGKQEENKKQSQKTPERHQKNKMAERKSALKQPNNKDEKKKKASQSQNKTATNKDLNKTADPELRKLEQVQNVRDPSRLLRAQLLLQAQRKAPPENNGKEW